MQTVTHSFWMAVRQLRGLVRQPWYIAAVIVQPIVWLLLYSELMERVVEIPGFGSTSYINFLTPGVIVMTALFGAGWNGMGIIGELDQGVMGRFLVTPVSRTAIVAGRVLSIGVISVFQSLMLLGLSLLLGARFAGGFGGVMILLISTLLLAMPVAAFSNGLALLVRREESLIGLANFILFPLTFLSPVFMSTSVMPRWIRFAASVNPINWSVQAGRAAVSSAQNWQFVWFQLSLLVVFAAMSASFAAWAFRKYQQSC